MESNINLVWIIIGVVAIIFIVLTAYFFIKDSIKNHKMKIVTTHSKMYQKILDLNQQYKFFDVENNFNFSETLNSIQKLNQFDFYNYIVNEISKLINYSYYKDIFYKISSNKNLYSEYLLKFNNINYTTKEEFDKLSNIKISYKSFLNYEKKLYQSLQIKQPILDASFYCVASYTSPAGRNHYTRSTCFKYKDLYHLFKHEEASKKLNQNNKPLSYDNPEMHQKEKIGLEEQRKEKEYKRAKAEENRKQIVKNRFSNIIDTFNEFEKNDKLLLIISNFLKQEEVNNVELFAIPKRKTSWYLKPLYTLQDLENTKDYNFDKIRHTLVAAYNKSQLQKDILDNYSLEEESSWNDNYSKYNKNENASIERLFKSLVGQNIIKNGSTEKETFYFLLSEKNREEKHLSFNDLSIQYDIKETLTDNEIIEKLYSNDLNIKDIYSFIALKIFVKNEYKLYSDCLEEAQKIVDECITEIKQKAYINRLLLGEPANKITLAEIDLMSGNEFENFVSELLKKMGYTTEVTKSSGDQGIDVIAIKNDFIVAIQAKCYSGIVGNHAIMEAVAGMKYYNANKCMVITNSTFSKSAIELAKVNNVELWDRQVLKEKIKEV